MERRRFGNTDLMVSAIGLGCYDMSGAYGPAEDAESIATIRRALDLGVNLLDTSASYGQGPLAERCARVMREALAALEATRGAPSQVVERSRPARISVVFEPRPPD